LFTVLIVAAEEAAKKSAPFCHSGRSEESLFDLKCKQRKKERFFASPRMTTILFFPAVCEAAARKDKDEDEDRTSKKRAAAET
jgi:hypothetical protein